jgi:hypothetical protein
MTEDFEMGNPIDQTFKRDLFNHWSRFGPAGLVEKRAGRWYVRFREYTYPTTFSTKKAAALRATEWVLATTRREFPEGAGPRPKAGEV